MSEYDSDDVSSDGEHWCPWDDCRRTFDTDHGMKVHHKAAHGESIAKVKTECDFCGAPVEGYQSVINDGKATFCSDDCQNEHHSDVMSGEAHPRYNRVSVSCECCGAELSVTEHTHKRNEKHFCDNACRGEWQAEHWNDESHPSWEGGLVTVECSWCGGDKDVKQYVAHGRDNYFCDNDCMAAWQAKQWSGEGSPRWNSEFIPCANCGDLLQTKAYWSELHDHRFCDAECKGEWQTENLVGEDNPHWLGGKPPYGAGWTDELKEQVRERQDRCCAGCGMHESENDRKLDVHHIQKARSFDDDEARNDESNLVALCRECHKEWERMSPLRPQTPFLD